MRIKKIFLPTIIYIIFLILSCNNYKDFGPAYTNHIEGLSVWYAKQLIPSNKAKLFYNSNNPNWSNVEVEKKQDTLLFKTLIFSKDKITRELHANYFDGVYGAVVREYNFSYKDSLTVRTLTVNGRVLDLGYFDYQNEYISTFVAKNTNIVLMGTEMGGIIPPVDIPNPGNGNTNPPSSPPPPTYPPNDDSEPNGGGVGSNGMIEFKFSCTINDSEFFTNFNNSMKNLENGLLGINQIDYGCFPKNILKAIKNKQGTSFLNVCFQQKPSGSNGLYFPNEKKLQFISSYVDDMTVLHELIHYYQDLSGYYPNMSSMGKNVDTGIASRGFANLEFETRLLLDIMKGYGDEYIYQLKKGDGLTKDELTGIKDDYTSFIESFRDIDGNLLNFNALNMSDFNTSYQKFLNFYGNNSGDYKSEIIPDMNPEVLKELQNFVFNNCEK